MSRLNNVGPMIFFLLWNHYLTNLRIRMQHCDIEIRFSNADVTFVFDDFKHIWLQEGWIIRIKALNTELSVLIADLFWIAICLQFVIFLVYPCTKPIEME